MLGWREFSSMNTCLRLVVSVLLVLSATVALAAKHEVDVQERRPARYPEGVSVIGDSVWYAEMGANVITRWRQASSESYSMPPGCGPTAVEAYAAQLIVLCHMSDELLLINANGSLVHSQRLSSAGELLYNPNDAVRDDVGGIYFSSSGKFALGARAEGKIFYLDKSGRIQRVANGLHYPNGVDFDADGERLLVAEHFGHRILSFDVYGPGELGQRRTLHELGEYLGETEDWMVGPDGLHLGADGTLRIAIYARGEVLAISPAGRLGRIVLPMRYTTTVLHDLRRGLLVGGAFDINTPGLDGELLLIAPGQSNYGAEVHGK
jgi:sugar lactone lactonase YvrE